MHLLHCPFYYHVASYRGLEHLSSALLARGTDSLALVLLALPETMMAATRRAAAAAA